MGVIPLRFTNTDGKRCYVYQNSLFSLLHNKDNNNDKLINGQSVEIELWVEAKDNQKFSKKFTIKLLIFDEEIGVQKVINWKQ